MSTNAENNFTCFDKIILDNYKHYSFQAKTYLVIEYAVLIIHWYCLYNNIFFLYFRHYYKLKHSKIKSVPHKKLVYKFTPEALTHKDFEEFSRCTNNLQIVPI